MMAVDEDGGERSGVEGGREGQRGHSVHWVQQKRAQPSRGASHLGQTEGGVGPEAAAPGGGTERRVQRGGGSVFSLWNPTNC